MNFLAELRRRNVIRMAGLYLVAAWLVVQVGATLLPVFEAPPWAMKALVSTLAVAFLPMLVLSWVFELAPEGLRRSADAPGTDAPSPRMARRLDRAIIAVLVLALGYFAFDKFVLSPRREAALVAQATHAGEQRALRRGKSRDRSVAVLPMLNASGDPGQRFFSDGLSESLIDALSKFDGLRVIGRTSSFQFRDSKLDAKGIGVKLGVSYLVGGSVQRTEDAVRIRAEMVDTRDGSALFAQQFYRPYRDLFALQDELTLAIAGALKAKLLPGTRDANRDRPPSGNLDAYTAYWRGLFAADMDSEQGRRKAIAELTRATTLDPGYAMAWAMLSRTWTSLAALDLGGDAARQAYAEAKRAGDTALELGPDLAQAHAARGWLLENSTFNWQAAGLEYKRALELDPADLQAKFNLASMEAVQGQLDKAIQRTGEAIERDPRSPNWWNWYSQFLAAVGRLDDAEAAIRKSLALHPQGEFAGAQLAIIQVQRGDPAAALRAARAVPEGVWRDIATTMALQIGADAAAADAALEKLVADYRDVAPYQIAEVYAIRRDADAVFEWLRHAREARDPGTTNLLMDPFLMRYKQDPRMAAFCLEIGLPPPGGSQAKAG